MKQENNDGKNKKRKKKNRHIGRKIFITLLVLMLLLLAGGAGVVLAVVKSAPPLDTDFLDNLKQSSKILDENGKYIENYSDAENRQIVPLNEIPNNLQNAFIAIEDQRFRTHHGIDIRRIMSALVYDIRTGSKDQGASTITQQLIKNYALTSTKSWTRKLTEAYMAIELERKLTKNQILEAYLNTINLGGNAYGVESASLLYFGKDTKDLNLAQCALIAGITQNPAKYYPYSSKNKKDPGALIDRQRTVLGKMLQLGFITQDQYNDAYNYKIAFTPKEAMTQSKYQWFIEPALDQVAQDFANKYGITETEAKQKLRTGGYTIQLTIDTKVQDKAESVINDPKYYPKLSKKNSYYAANPKDTKLIQPQAAAVIIDSTTGEVRAVVGGRGPHPLLSYNRATDPEMARQPGSSIKPLAVYSPAIEDKIATAATVIDDSPMPESFVAANNGWNPQNYDGVFRGYTTVRNAIKDSVNLVAVKLLQQVGINTAIDFLQNKYHLTTIVSDRNAKRNDLGLAQLALGGLTNGVTPLQMAAAYSVFANGGIYSQPMFYTVVKDNQGSVVLDKTPVQSRSISPQAAFIMSSMLQTVVKSGTGVRASLGSMPAGGKTGTTDDHTNGWFMGITPYYTGAVWMGSDDSTVHVPGLVGGTEAPMWKAIMQVAHQGLPVKNFPVPSTGIVQASACLDSGDAPSDLCALDQRGSRVYTEYFIEGTQPVQICNVHEELSIDTRNGKLATPDTPIEYISKKVFIKRDPTPGATTLDSKYAAPTEYSDLNGGQNPGGTNDQNPTDTATDPNQSTTGTGESGTQNQGTTDTGNTGINGN